MTLKWKPHPRIYEINTWPWLNYLSKHFQHPITLKNIPDQIFTTLFHNFDVIWLMGIWKRSHQSKKIATTHEDLKKDFRNTLENFEEKDVIGSPYAIFDYEVEPNLGGMEGFNQFSKKLHEQGKMIIVDFVPNHVAVDHPWLQDHPEFFIQGTSQNLVHSPKSFFQKNGYVFAHGKDPYFDAWTDTAQLNAFNPDLRKRMIKILSDLASFSDGIRCDMAMLVETNVFYRTWQDLLAYQNETQYWEEIIPKIKAENPEFKFFAEVYWDMEWPLQQQGFDFCYDKRLYDRILQNRSEVHSHLHATWEYQSKLVRFIENHDESRISALCTVSEQKPLISLVLTLPGAHLVHFGQMKGYTTKLPVQLNRYPEELENNELKEFYNNLFCFLGDNFGMNGDWRLLSPTSNIPSSHHNKVILYMWEFVNEILLVCVNFSELDGSFTIGLEQEKTWDKFKGYSFKTLFSSTNDDIPDSFVKLRGKSIKIPSFGYILVKFTLK